MELDLLPRISKDPAKGIVEIGKVPVYICFINAVMDVLYEGPIAFL
jgi:hypothetical protein